MKKEEKSTFGDRMSKNVEYKIVKEGKTEKSENDKSEKEKSN